MVHASGAHSTDLESPESVEHLMEKTEEYAKNWKPEADRLWKISHHTPYKETHEYIMSREEYEQTVGSKTEPPDRRVYAGFLAFFDKINLPSKRRMVSHTKIHCRTKRRL